MDSACRVIGWEVKGVDKYTILKTIKALQGNCFGRKRDARYFDSF